MPPLPPPYVPPSPYAPPIPPFPVSPPLFNVAISEEGETGSGERGSSDGDAISQEEYQQEVTAAEEARAQSEREAFAARLNISVDDLERFEEENFKPFPPAPPAAPAPPWSPFVTADVMSNYLLSSWAFSIFQRFVINEPIMICVAFFVPICFANECVANICGESINEVINIGVGIAMNIIASLKD